MIFKIVILNIIKYSQSKILEKLKRIYFLRLGRQDYYTHARRD